MLRSVTPTTQLKATNLQRAGNGLSQAEKAMRQLKASTESIERAILDSINQGGDPSRLQARLSTELQELTTLQARHPALAEKVFPNSSVFPQPLITPEQRAALKDLIQGSSPISSNPMDLLRHFEANPLPEKNFQMSAE
jgi:hypothetical protein